MQEIHLNKAPWENQGDDPTREISMDVAPWDDNVTQLEDIVVTGSRGQQIRPDDEEKSGWESGARGFAQGLSFGLADEAVAGLKSIPRLWGRGQGWQENIANERAHYDQAKADNPEAYLAGDVGGSVAGAFIPGVGLAGLGARGAGVGARLGGAAIRGGLSGAVNGAGRAEGNLLERADEAAIGGALGGVLGGTMGAVSPALSNGGRWVNDATNRTVGTVGNLTDNVASHFGGGVRGGAIRELGKPVDDIADNLIDRLAQSNPGAANAAGHAYNTMLGGSQGVRGRIAADAATGGMFTQAELAARSLGNGMQIGGRGAGSTTAQSWTGLSAGGLAEAAQSDPWAPVKDPMNVMRMTQGSKFEPALRSALERGPQALRAAIFTLRNDPEFRQIMGVDLSGTGSITVD